MSSSDISDALRWALSGEKEAEAALERAGDVRGWRRAAEGAIVRPRRQRAAQRLARTVRRAVGWTLASLLVCCAGLAIGFVGLLLVLEAWL